jgi:hypothetical protein
MSCINTDRSSDPQLIVRLKSAAKQERLILQQILKMIAEIDRQKLYLQQAYPSMFEFLVREIGYSEGAAQRRIDAARLIAKIPELSHKIQDGSLKLSQITKLQCAVRQIKKTTGASVNLQKQKEVLDKIQNLPAAQTDLVLVNEFQIQPQQRTVTRQQSDQSVRFEITFTKEEFAILQNAQQSLSHATGGGLKETIIHLAKKQIGKPLPTTATVAASTRGKDLVEAANTRNKESADQESSCISKTKSLTYSATSQKSESVSASQSGFTATVAASSRGKDSTQAESADSKADNQLALPIPKSITPKLRRTIYQRDQCCQYTDKKTGKICGSKFFLQVDHIQPQWDGGTNQSANLRLLCSLHNKYRYSTGA